MPNNWIQTYTGRAFYPMDPRPEEVNLEDIAHSLANQCRFGGHTVEHYSVAEHSYWVALQVPPELRLVALLHDATEAYVMDLPSPIKAMLPDYSVMEQRVWEAIAQRFDLPVELPPEVKRADAAVLAAEGTQVLAPPGAARWTTPLPPPAKIWVRFWYPENAKRHFLRAFEEYSK